MASPTYVCTHITCSWIKVTIGNRAPGYHLHRAEKQTHRSLLIFPGLIRIFKGNFPKEKHFNTMSLMAHQHVGLCAAYVTFTCHN